ncbi:hypothetical protein GCM10010339_83070 [Streptomyces alanosinicus]|uniref:Uncharacterized protein n=1 Tax=Streptomyces alanosinicus TaxID=68171 RepID=A0A919D7D5_9ACTN|nr:hypothetical protein GCM10010339_83070 [Streptomyces alanosinicus]
MSGLLEQLAEVPDPRERLQPAGQVPRQRELNPAPFTNAAGSTSRDLCLRADRFRAVLAADLPLNVSRLTSAEQRPFAASSLTDVTMAAAWHTIPSWVIVAESGKAHPAGPGTLGVGAPTPTSSRSRAPPTS